MGNYNCQECIDKEVNILNELLLKNNIFSNDSIEQDNANLTQISHIKNINSSKDDLRKALKKTNLSEKQKNFAQKILNENIDDSSDLEEDNNIIKLRVEKNNKTDENINNNNENDKINEEHEKIIEDQKEQILEQEKIIEDYKIKQLLLEEQQIKLKEEEEYLKKQIEQAQKNEEGTNDEQQQENFEELGINNLESPKIENENGEYFENEENNEQIIDNQEQENNENENEMVHEQISVINPENNSINFLTQNLHQKNIENEEEKKYMEEEESLNIQPQQIINYNNYIQYQNQIQQQYNEGIELRHKQPQHHQSQRFKVETYEPIEQVNKNNDDNDIDETNINENEDVNLYEKIKKNSIEPRDNIKSNRRKSIPKKDEEDINDINNYINYVQEKVVLRERIPKDNEKSNINYKYKISFEEENKMNFRNREEKENIKKTGPLDSKRSDLEQKFNKKENIFIFNKKGSIKQKNKTILNRNDMKEEEAFESQDIKINEKKIKANPISSAISKGILNEYNYIQQQQQNNEPYLESHDYFIKKEILNPSITTNQYYPPQDSEKNYIASNNNMNNLENYESREKEVNIMATSNQFNENVVTLAPSSDQVVEKNSNGPIIPPKGNEVQQYDYVEFQQSSQKDYDMTFSERDNPLIYSDDKGNMNYLERQYAAYENRMNNNNDY